MLTKIKNIWNIHCGDIFIPIDDVSQYPEHYLYLWSFRQPWRVSCRIGKLHDRLLRFVPSYQLFVKNVAGKCCFSIQQ